MRELARDLGLSAATVSLALRSDARITPETTARVKALAASRGYHADPVVAEGLSRARRHDFYRETVGWLLDRPQREQPWFEKLFSAAAESGRRLGYEIEYFAVDFSDEAALQRMARICKARGIRGLLLGPLEHAVTDPALPWQDFSWVTIGQSLTSPALHRVGRDYDKDIDCAVAYLRRRGCKRPAFLVDNTMDHLMGLPLLRAALVYYHKQAIKMPEPFYNVEMGARPSAFARWVKQNQPDGLVVGMSFMERADTLHQVIAHLPQVELSPLGSALLADQPKFVRDYSSMGHSAIGLLHRLIINEETGVLRNTQTVVVSSVWQE